MKQDSVSHFCWLLRCLLHAHHQTVTFSVSRDGLQHSVKQLGLGSAPPNLTPGFSAGNWWIVPSWVGVICCLSWRSSSILGSGSWLWVGCPPHCKKQGNAPFIPSSTLPFPCFAVRLANRHSEIKDCFIQGLPREGAVYLLSLSDHQTVLNGTDCGYRQEINCNFKANAWRNIYQHQRVRSIQEKFLSLRKMWRNFAKRGWLKHPSTSV